MAKKRVTTKKAGNTKGTKTKSPTAQRSTGRSRTNDVPASRCECGSTERTAYHNVITKQIDGIGPDGKVYDTVRWRSTRCKKCGQKRVDRSFLKRRRGKP